MFGNIPLEVAKTKQDPLAKFGSYDRQSKYFTKLKKTNTAPSRPISITHFRPLLAIPNP